MGGGTSSESRVGAGPGLTGDRDRAQKPCMAWPTLSKSRQCGGFGVFGTTLALSLKDASVQELRGSPAEGGGCRQTAGRSVKSTLF